MHGAGNSAVVRRICQNQPRNIGSLPSASPHHPPRYVLIEHVTLRTTCSPLHRSWTIRNRRVATLLVSDLPLPDDPGRIGTNTYFCGVNA
ncbi:hypothetical protein COCVIDRAFT_87885 [Bipolaris victoriae FI3]|uniref:Uncharacterized protein n=2 Tax=Bipolaris TaxID=33194 RepID=W6XRV5_COCC2|nr:uncharacterized protein COCCADRAFT_104538 [Bipolaris zeicola 26-R-13]XP_014560963.1 hypothetical protein COCVIDRAFT_87885 [Bipolaris victoriae FI3]EUC30177.1 hypothetical protein COCCADRAFT_104538 [Bipolaris zeicola 26-R-13]